MAAKTDQTTVTPEDERHIQAALLRAARRFGRSSKGLDGKLWELEKKAKTYARVYDALHGTKEEE